MAVHREPRTLEVGSNMRIALSGATLLSLLYAAVQFGQWKERQDVLLTRVEHLEAETVRNSAVQSAFQTEVRSDLASIRGTLLLLVPDAKRPTK